MRYFSHRLNKSGKNKNLTGYVTVARDIFTSKKIIERVKP